MAVSPLPTVSRLFVVVVVKATLCYLELDLAAHSGLHARSQLLSGEKCEFSTRCIRGAQAAAIVNFGEVFPVAHR